VVSKHLTPLFRDRSDASAGHDLGKALNNALKDSEFLIVLGSPASAKSRWVNAEIRTFKALGRADRIFAVLVEGRPCRYDASSAPDGAFAPALFQEFDEDGAVISEDGPEPLAADVREAGDGFHTATLKLIAAITGIPLTQLTDRHREAEQRERKIIRIVAATMTVLAIAAVLAAVLAWRSEKTAQRRLAAAVKMAASGLDDAVEFRDSYDVPAAVIRALLEGAQQDFGELTQDAGQPALELERVRLLTHFSDLYAALGEGDAQLKVAREALETVDRVRAGRQFSKPSSWFSPVELSTVNTDRLGAIDALGLALSDNDLTEEAWKQFQDGLMLAESSGDPLHVARFRTRLGEELYYRGDLRRARSEYDAAIAVLEDVIRLGDDRAADARQSQAGIRSDLANALLENGLSVEALDVQTRSVETLREESERHPENTLMRQHLADGLLRLGPIKYSVSGSWDDSMPNFDEAIRILDDLHARDPARMDYTRDLSIALERRGDAYLQRRQIDEAKRDFAMMERLRRGIAAEKPSRQASRDIAVALERQASVAMASKDMVRTFEVLNELQDLRIEAANKPKDFVAQRDLAVTWNLIAKARTQYCRSDWQAAHEESIKRMESLLGLENAVPGWMRDLAVFRLNFGDALYLAGRVPQARAQWSSALKLVTDHLEEEPKHPLLPNDKALLEARISGKSRPAALDCRLE
jgi:tetratricopeptide (TPR) repeat protein